MSDAFVTTAEMESVSPVDTLAGPPTIVEPSITLSVLNKLEAFSFLLVIPFMKAS